MIDKVSYTKEWIIEKTGSIDKATDPKLMEKVIRAFGLLEQLTLMRLPIVFKGGTSLLLHAGSNPQRYSIDIDIISECAPQEIPPVLNKIVENGEFTRWQDDNQRTSTTKAPIGHYKLYYNSAVEEGAEEYVLLDVLFAKATYAFVQGHPISHPWLATQDQPSLVLMPDMSSLMGDKLTAFAPNTIGILYTKKRHTEIMKQLFDLGFLFQHLNDLSNVRESYVLTATTEIANRGLDITWQDTLKDSFDTCLLITNRDEKDEKFIWLLEGNKRLINFILRTYSLDHAIVAAAKTAYLIQLIRNSHEVWQQYTGPEQVRDLLVDHSVSPKIQKLKKSNPEAFFYWYHALALK
ncbi:MAG: nucleotidyl transferase AbiEii/AbiGii toxin family protein [Pseudobacter sp.]|uniref:nucleotidyl transferase AbiEii/AbiGii toxin family protein n=1 Tax=Pseudobacter sp. TaxID=2045420 RepID=UPI003F813AF3